MSELWLVNWLSGSHLLLILSLPGTTISFLFVLFCVLRTWPGNSQVGPPKMWPGGNVSCLSLPFSRSESTEPLEADPLGSCIASACHLPTFPPQTCEMVQLDMIVSSMQWFKFCSLWHIFLIVGVPFKCPLAPQTRCWKPFCTHDICYSVLSGELVHACLANLADHGTL